MMSNSWAAVDKMLGDVRDQTLQMKYPWLDPLREAIPQVEKMLADSRRLLGDLSDLEADTRLQVVPQLEETVKALEACLLNLFFQPSEPPVSEAAALYESVKVLYRLASQGKP
jgi:hypothetical protein